MKSTPPDGLLVIDKPRGITPRDVVNRIQEVLPRRTRIGHTGTLDPLATGVLVLCVGSATRLTQYVQAMSKTYRSRFRLGARSDTDDADGAIPPLPAVNPPDTASVCARFLEFVGTIQSVPPAFSDSQRSV